MVLFALLNQFAAAGLGSSAIVMGFGLAGSHAPTNRKWLAGWPVLSWPSEKIGREGVIVSAVDTICQFERAIDRRTHKGAARLLCGRHSSVSAPPVTISELWVAFPFFKLRSRTPRPALELAQHKPLRPACSPGKVIDPCGCQ